MKKILLLLLSLTLVFGCLTSCGNNNGANTDAGNGANAPEKGTVDYIAYVVSNSLPTRIVTHTNFVDDSDTLSGVYTTEVDRENKKTQFSFEYDRIAIPGVDNSEDYVKTEAGLVQFKDGMVLRSEGSDWETLGDGYLTLSLSIVQSMLATAEVSEDGCDLVATVSAQNTERVFGSAIDAKGDVTLEIDTNGTYLYSVKISYVANGTDASITVETSYEYAPIVFDF